MDLLNTSCPDCGHDCVIDKEYLEHKFPVPKEVPIENTIWICTYCKHAFTYNTLLILQQEKYDHN